MPQPWDTADIVEADAWGPMELHRPAIVGDEAMVRRSLENGADISAKDEEGRTALHVAARGGHEAVVRLLLEKKADISAKDDDGWPALFFAIAHGNMAVVRLLVGEEEAEINLFWGELTALQVAAMFGHQEAARLLVEKGARIGTKDRFGWTALHRGSSAGQLATVQLLLEKGADITTVTEKGSTALHLAAEKGKHDVVRFLLEKGADIAAVDTIGWTALHRTVDNGHETVALLLLEQGADISATDDHGAMALHRAAGRGYEEMVRLLLEKGADLTARDSNGFTPLHVATARADEAVLNILLENGADWSAKDKNECTALSYAMSAGNEAVIKLLVEAVPGLTEVVSERAIGDKKTEDTAESGMEQQFAAMDVGLHHLCDLCSKINFPALHGKELCASAGCKYHIAGREAAKRPFNRERLEDHSLEYKHHASLDALCVSAQTGCHLCSLMAFGLQHSYERLTSCYGPAQGGVILVYHKSSEWTKKEELEIFCGDLFTLLPVTNVPPKRCSERGFSGAGWDVQGGGQTDVDSYGLANIKALFYARCVRPNHPTWGYRYWDKVDASSVGGFQRIQSYMPGQVCLLWLCLNDGLTTPHPEATITREAN
jgi:ankyrin repeat protein